MREVKGYTADRGGWRRETSSERLQLVQETVQVSLVSRRVRGVCRLVCGMCMSEREKVWLVCEYEGKIKLCVCWCRRRWW